MVTIKEIAREANVSPTTVSLILNNKSKERKISAQTEQRVLQIAEWPRLPCRPRWPGSP